MYGLAVGSTQFDDGLPIGEGELRIVVRESDFFAGSEGTVRSDDVIHKFFLVRAGGDDPAGEVYFFHVVVSDPDPLDAGIRPGRVGSKLGQMQVAPRVFLDPYRERPHCFFDAVTRRERALVGPGLFISMACRIEVTLVTVAEIPDILQVLLVSVRRKRYECVHIPLLRDGGLLCFRFGAKYVLVSRREGRAPSECPGESPSVRGFLDRRTIRDGIHRRHVVGREEGHGPVGIAKREFRKCTVNDEVAVRGNLTEGRRQVVRPGELPGSGPEYPSDECDGYVSGIAQLDPFVLLALLCRIREQLVDDDCADRRKRDFLRFGIKSIRRFGSQYMREEERSCIGTSIRGSLPGSIIGICVGDTFIRER